MFPNNIKHTICKHGDDEGLSLMATAKILISLTCISTLSNSQLNLLQIS